MSGGSLNDICVVRFQSDDVVIRLAANDSVRTAADGNDLLIAGRIDIERIALDNARIHSRGRFRPLLDARASGTGWAQTELFYAVASLARDRALMFGALMRTLPNHKKDASTRLLEDFESGIPAIHSRIASCCQKGAHCRAPPSRLWKDEAGEFCACIQHASGLLRGQLFTRQS
jgi:hypothetical protein